METNTADIAAPTGADDITTIAAADKLKKYDKIPAVMKNTARWLVWRHEFRNKDEVKTTKVPYNATRPQQKAASTDQTTWCTYHQAVDASRLFDGIGFVLGRDETTGKTFLGIDWDDVRDPATGEWKTGFLDEIVSLGSYAEISPSGSGAHVIGYGTKPGTKCRKDPYEMYDHARFFATTGSHIPGNPEDVHDLNVRALEKVYAKICGSPEAAPAPVPATPESARISDDDLIRMIERSAQGSKFSRLWQGDHSGYDSRSEAVLALANILVWWTHGDTGWTDRLMQKSSLVDQAKWKRTGRKYEIPTASADVALADSPPWLGKTAGRKAGKDNNQTNNNTSHGDSQASALIKYTESEDVELFHDEKGEPFVRLRIDDRLHNVSTRERAFKRWLAKQHYAATGKAPGNEAVSSALNVIEAQACFDGKGYTLHNRLCWHEKEIWYDVGDGSAVRITETEWTVVDKPPILFRRYAHQKPHVGLTVSDDTVRISSEVSSEKNHEQEPSSDGLTVLTVFSPSILSIPATVQTHRFFPDSWKKNIVESTEESNVDADTPPHASRQENIVSIVRSSETDTGDLKKSDDTTDGTSDGIVRKSNHSQSVEKARVLEFTNIAGEKDRMLFDVYLTSLYIPDIPHPTLVFSGEKGAAKSTGFKVVKEVVDPSILQIATFPKDNNELVQLLSHHYFIGFDNVTNLSGWQSDAICRAVTGEGLNKRVLHTDDEDVIYTYKRCVGLNGINVVATKPDLLDRSLLIRLDRIKKGNRKTEAELWKEFNEAKGEILRRIFSAVAGAMALYPAIKNDELPRMADFAKWGCAIAQALGYDPAEFLDAYNENIQTQNKEAIESSPVGVLVLEFMKDKSAWTGTPSDLLIELEFLAGACRVNTQGKGFPKAANTLTRRLNELKSNLQEEGITFEQSRDTTGDKRTITLVRSETNRAHDNKQDKPVINYPAVAKQAAEWEETQQKKITRENLSQAVDDLSHLPTSLSVDDLTEHIRRYARITPDDTAGDTLSESHPSTKQEPAQDEPPERQESTHEKLKTIFRELFITGKAADTQKRKKQYEAAKAHVQHDLKLPYSTELIQTVFTGEW